jgi:phage terminase small subunit
MVDLNATRAAIAAGYSKNTAAQAGWEVLRNPKVSEEIERRQHMLAERLAVTAENVLSELAKLAFANMGDFYKVGEDGRREVNTTALADPSKSAALVQIDTIEKPNGEQSLKIKLADKRAALTDLGKHLGLFSGKAELAVTVENAEPRSDRTLALHVLALIGRAQHEAGQEILELEAL